MAGPLLVSPVIANLIEATAPALANHPIDYAIDQAYDGGVASITDPSNIIVAALGGYTDFGEDIKKVLRQNVSVLLAAFLTTSYGDIWHTVGGPGEPPFESTYTAPLGSFQVPQFRLEGDVVRLRGAASGGAVGNNVFTLPVGYRPPAALRFSIATASTTNPGYVNVLTDGSIVCFVGSPSQLWLDGISFSITP